MASLITTDLSTVLACPSCGGRFKGPIQPWDRAADLTFTCGSCDATSHVDDGIWRAMGHRRVDRTVTQVINRLPPAAWIYERLWRRFSLTLLTQRRFPIADELAELDAALDPGEGQIVVDVACSEGLYARHLAASGAIVFAVDHSLPFLRAAQRRATAAGVVVLPVQAVAEGLPFSDRSVDATSLGGSLNELEDQPVAVGELGRITKAGGATFDMSLVHSPSRIGRFFQRLFGPGGVVAFSAPETVEMYERAGFDVDRVVVDRLVLRLTGRKPLGELS